LATTILPGYPDATTTGVPAGTVLSAYTGPSTITRAGTVIEVKIIDGGLVINAPNVTIKNCVVTNGYWWGIDGEHGGSTLLVQNCDIIGPGIEGNSGILGTGSFIGNDISGYENGIMSSGGSGGVFNGNYIHDLKSTKADPHYTGIQVEGGESNLRIENNTVINDQDSNIFLQALYGPISNVVINHNWVGGSNSGNNSYNIYVESRFGYPITDVSITNNYINKGYYGYFSIVNSSPTMSGNVLFDSDHGISPPTGGSSTPPTGPTPPSAPVIASFSDDTGSVGDGITKDNTLQLKGTAAANSSVKVYDGSTQIGATTADSTGEWDYITSVLTNAKHVLTVTATNATGQISAASAALAVTVDTIAPGAPVVVSDSVVNTNHVSVSGTAAANSSITVYDGNTVVGTGATNSSGNWSVTTSTLSNGAHALTAKATDVAGNVSVASEAFDPVIGAPPTPPTSPAAPKIVSFSEDSGIVGDHITNDNTLMLSGTALANSTVKVFDGSTQAGTATANSSGAWSLTTTTLVDGSHSLTAATTTTSAPGASPLIFEDFNPWSGTVSPDGIWRIAGTWTGTGNNTLQPGNVSFTDTYPGQSDKGFMSLTVPAGSPLRGAELQSLTTPGYSYGYYEVRMETANVKGGGVASFFWIEQPNYGSHEWDIEFTLSDSWAGTTNPGRVSFTTHPLDNTQWVNLGFNPSQAFHDYGFLWTPGRIDFTVDGQVVRTVTDPELKTDATGYIMMNTWSSGNPNFGGGPPPQDATSVYDWVKFYPGATSIPADTGSTAGTSSASAPLSVTIDTKAPGAPTIAAAASSSSQAAASAETASANVVNLTGTAEANSTVNILDGVNQIGTAAADAKGAWSYTTAPLASGNHSFTAKAVDAAGNMGTASAALAVNILSTTPTPPAAPTIVSFSNDSGVAGDHITNDGTLSLTGTAAANTTVTVFEGTKQIGTATANSSGAWNYTTGALSDGNHSLTATDTDSSGHTSSASSALAVTIDTHAPATPTMAVYSQAGTTVGGTTTSDDLLLKGTAEANSTVNILDGGKQIGTTTAGSNGLWSLDTGHLADGSHSFTSTASDAAGNTSVASAVAGVTVDAPASAVGITRMYENSSHIVTIKGTADAFSQIKIYDGTKSVGLLDTGADGTWSYTTASAISKTVHTFSAQEIDETGHVVGSSGSAILGTTRNDALTSTDGNDLFKGYGGHDTFVFAPNFGQDVIKDFAARGWSHDVVQFSKSVFDNFADVLAHATQSGHDVVIAAGTGDSLTLKNVKLAALDKTDFHFS
jgi:beta-glucanase (GH16 family)